MAQRRKNSKPRGGAKSAVAAKAVSQPAKAAAPADASGVDFLREAVRLHMAGKLAEAVPFYRQALEVNRGPAVLNNLGAALRDLKRPAEAVALFREAVATDASYADGTLNLGLCLNDLGDTAAAAVALQRALELLPQPQRGRPTDPRTLQAIAAMGTILRGQQRFDDQIALYRKAVDQAPDDATLHCQLGSVYFDLNKLPEALQSFETAARLDPKLVAAQGNLGTTYSTLGRADEAVACQRRAIALEPENPKHFVNLGAALKAQGLLGEAADAYRKAAALKPDYDYAVNNLGNLLREQGRLQEAIECFREAIRISPDYLTAFSNLLFTLNSLPELSAQEICAEHRRFGEIVEAKALPHVQAAAPYENSPDPERRIRIGYLSPDFLGHSVAYFMENLLEHHDRSQVEVVCYALNKRSDSLSRRLHARADIWRSCSFLSDAELAALIREDKIDILVELAGHTADNRLSMMAYRPAPVQVTYLGYPNTTGLKTIDYRLTDALVDPEGESDAAHTEKLVRLPRSFLCYRPSDFAPEVSSRPALANGYVTFGSFNVLAKMTDAVVETWATILKQVPKSRLLLKCNAFSDPDTVELYRRRFRDLGISEDRVDLLGRQPLIGDHLAMYGRVDIALDPFPYNGTTTTCEVLHMGVPMIALRGQRHVGRVSAALLHHVGLDELIADTLDDYVAKAVALARDPTRLQALSAGLRPAMEASPLMDAAGFTREMEAAYRGMWRNWCAAQPASGKKALAGPKSPPAKTAPSASSPASTAEVAAGAALFERGDYPGAEQAFRRAVAAQPDNAEAILNLGTTLKRQRRLPEALDCFQKAAALQPQWAAAFSNLASALCDLGRLDEAEAACRRAIEIDPRNRNAHSNLASVYAGRRKDAEAIPLFQKAIAIGPANAELYVNLSASCIATGRLEEAVAACRSAIALQPDLAEAHANLASALGAQGKLHESIAAARDVVKLKPQLQLAWSNLLFSMNYADDIPADAIAREHADWGRRLLPLAQASHDNARDPARRLKVGFISADFCAHSVAFFLKPLFDRHDPAAIEIHCYSDVVNPDLYTDFLKGRAAVWRSVVGLTDERVAEMIRADRVDVLIDLAGHTSKNRLGVFARKPCPVQVTWLGYPNTTGLKAIDWRFVDAVTDPEGMAEAHAVERLQRMPVPFLCYEAAPKTPDVAPLPALANGHVTFGCFNKINKISDRTVRLWARVLAAVPNSRMILKSLSFNDAATRDRLTGIMAEAGISADRISLLGWEPLLKGHLEVYHRIDIALDTYPYNGTTTTCEAAWMGVPTVTLCGDRHAARVGASIDTALGLPHLAPSDEAGFVAAAAALADDIDALAALRLGLRARMQASPLCDAPAFARKFEAALRAVWQDWCGGARTIESAAAAIESGERGFIRLQTRGGFAVQVPDDTTLITPYILLEQEDWFEEEAPFIRRLLRPGERVLDIGANYGLYTLSAARAVGQEGRVWSFEPAGRTASCLTASIAANRLDNVTVIRAGLSDRVGTAQLKISEQAEFNSFERVAQGDTAETETVAITTLDTWAGEQGWPDIDFVKLDAEGEEANIIRAGAAFFSRLSPLVMFEVKHGEDFNVDLQSDFQALGYDPYRLVPGLGVLVPYVPDDSLRGGMFNLFCCKPDRAAKLAAQGLLARSVPAYAPAQPEGTLWPQWLAALPYAASRMSLWRSGPALDADYASSLDAWCLSQDVERDPGERFAALDYALRTLEHVAQTRAGWAVLFSYARVARAFGYRGHVVAALRAAQERLNADRGDLPFLSPVARFDTLPDRGDPVTWCRAAALEGIIDGSNYSSLFGSYDARQLEAMRQTGFHDIRHDRAAQLIRLRAKQPPEHPLPARLLRPAPDNLNAAWWTKLAGKQPEGAALLDLLPEFGRVNIVDIGAMALGDETEPYRPLLRLGKARVVGFEPNQVECDKLNATAEGSVYYPYFIGDGSERTFYETNLPMTGSLYKPNAPLMKKLHFMEELTALVAEHHGIRTRRLDDLADLDGLDDVDLIKIDVQGAELDVFRGAERALRSATVIITEVEFIPLYENQPLFGDIDRHLRGHGFEFHTFKGFGRRFFKPFNSPTNPQAAFRQVLWSDAVFVKDFMNLDRLPDDKLLKMAVILDTTLDSFDLAAMALAEYDRRHRTGFADTYVSTVLGRWQRARAEAVAGEAPHRAGGVA
jgi:FkbM family methyltransferase